MTAPGKQRIIHIWRVYRNAAGDGHSQCTCGERVYHQHWQAAYDPRNLSLPAKHKRQWEKVPNNDD